MAGEVLVDHGLLAPDDLKHFFHVHKNVVLPQSLSSDERKELKDEFNRLVVAINALEARVVLLENPG